MRIPFGTQSYRHASLPLSAQRMVNCYLEAAPPQAKTFAAVVSSHGVITIGSAGGPTRGERVVRGILYRVAGDGLYRISPLGVATRLGTIPGSNRVFLAGDETNLLIVTNPNGYFWNGSVVAQVTDPDWPGASWCDNLDGYYVIIQPDTGKYYVTANRNPSSINALDFASAEASPDDLVTGIVDHRELVLFGTESIEGFHDSGNADFPITKSQGADIEVGCVAPFGPAKTDNTIFFPGSDGKVYRLNGWTPTVISTTVVEQAIAKAVDRNFIGFAWSEPGHTFYSLKCDDFAFIYDVATNLWYERASYGFSAWRWASVTRAYEKWFVGDAESEAIGILSPDSFTEFGATMRASCTSPSVSEDNVRLTHHRLELVFEQGVGSLSGQGADPQVMLRHSDDGARTWSSERWRSLGRMGDFKSRAVWNRNGQARDRIYEYAITDPVRRTLILATAEVERDAA